MRTIRISVELPDNEYASYASEAKRQGRTVEDLVTVIIKTVVSKIGADVDDRFG